MASEDDERSPLLSSNRTQQTDAETEPLLPNQSESRQEEERNDGEADESSSSKRWFSWLPKLNRKSKDDPSVRSRRWPSIVAMAFLAILIILVIILGFMLPPAVQRYVEKALVLEPTDLTLESLKSEGARARVQANLRIDGSRVKDANSRRVGKMVTGIMRKLATKETEVQVSLPDFDNAILGTAMVPSLVVDIRHGHENRLDFVTDLNPGDSEDIRAVINRWLDGKLDHLMVTGTTSVKLQSGVFPLGTHDVQKSIVFEAKQLPTVPEYEVKNLTFHDLPVDDQGHKLIGSDVTVTAFNRYSINGEVPSLAFEILVPNCDPSEPKIKVAEALTSVVKIEPNHNVTAKASAIVNNFPDSLTRSCPDTALSPLDDFMKHYLQGGNVTIYVRGKKEQPTGTPQWIGDVLQDIMVPFEYQTNPFNDFIRNFSLSDVHFALPNPFADPNDPEGSPRVSGVVEVLGALPPGVQIGVDVKGIKAVADLFYEAQKMGELNLRQWQDANSTRVVDAINEEDFLKITSRIVNVPINITDSDVFSDLMQEVLFGNKQLELTVKSAVDVQLSTVLGLVALKEIPATGKIPIERLPRDLFAALHPRITDLHITDTSSTGFSLEALVDVKNPTPYTATIPYANVHVLDNDTILGEAVVRNIEFGLGDNNNTLVQSTWDPLHFGGKLARDIGRRLLSSYVSGKNTTLTIQTHNNSIPSLPHLGEALSNIKFKIPAPRLRTPNDTDGDGDHSRFIRSADFHIFGSEATFVLASPLQHDNIYIIKIDATAYYNHTEPIGRIVHEAGFPVVPGLTVTPRLPVEWSASSIGYEKLKEALGGQLKLDAVANVTVKLGDWIEELEYVGTGIGAHVHL